MKKKKKLKTAGIIIGNVVVCAAALIVVPKAVSNMSGYLFKRSMRSSNAKTDVDDWEPEFVDTDETEEEE